MGKVWGRRCQAREEPSRAAGDTHNEDSNESPLQQPHQHIAPVVLVVGDPGVAHVDGEGNEEELDGGTQQPGPLPHQPGLHVELGRKGGRNQPGVTSQPRDGVLGARGPWGLPVAWLLPPGTSCSTSQRKSVPSRRTVCGAKGMGQAMSEPPAGPHKTPTHSTGSVLHLNTHLGLPL